METSVLKVGGMTCGGCVNSVTRVIQSIAGVQAAEVSLETAQAKVTFDPARTTLAQIRVAIEHAGYAAQ
ncbi:MAG TPA: cation transporter [Burkholderiales bacterium]|nr:cation transporter [Burkholderiales bacterium]